MLAAGGVGHALVAEFDSEVGRVDPFEGMKDRPQNTGGMNLLVVGVDGREKLSGEEKERYRLGGTSCDCTDTLMLVRISQDRERASVVSLPRDSYVTLPEHTDPDTGRRHKEQAGKLNSAYASGGPGLTVRTVERMTDVHVDHYLEVDFTSFMSTVDAVGGVEICTKKPLRDSHSGLDLPAGTSRLNGGEALQYVRARHLDGASDLGRVQRQQRFLASLIKEATDSEVLMNPMEFKKVASSVLGSLRADHGFGTGQMMALGQALRGFSPGSSEFSTVPLADTDHRVAGLGSTVRWDEERAAELFTAFRQDRSLTQAKKASAAGDDADSGGDAKGRDGQDGKRPEAASVEVAPGEVRVEVENGTERPGLARSVQNKLRETGFTTPGAPKNAARNGLERTTIEYDPRWADSARSLAAALPGAKLREDSGRGPVAKVTTGAKSHTVRPVRPDDPASNAGKLNAATGDDKADCGGGATGA